MFLVSAVMSNNSTSLSEEASCISSFGTLNPLASNISPVDQHHQKIKKKRNLPGNPDPDAEVIALSPRTLLATNRFVCEICKKGFQRDQNLQLHRRGHNLPWKLKQRNNRDVIKKKAYVCPEASCIHHHPSRALGDLTGIKKHFYRKHGEKKWKCEKCAKIYAVQSDWKAHSKTCGTREYRCDCGALFSRKDSFVTHRAFCDALAEESARLSAAAVTNAVPILMPSSSTTTAQPGLDLQQQQQHHHQPFSLLNQYQQEEEQQHDHYQNPLINIFLNTWDPSPPPPPPPQNPNPNPAILHHNNNHILNIKPEPINNNNNIDLSNISNSPLLFYQEPPPPSSSYKNFMMMTSPFQSCAPPPAAHLLSATALLQKAATAGAHPAGHVPSAMSRMDLGHVTAGLIPPVGNFSTWQQRSDHQRGLTRDFLRLTGDRGNVDVNVNVNVNGRNLLSFTRGLEFPTYVGFATAQPPAGSETTRGNC